MEKFLRAAALVCCAAFAGMFAYWAAFAHDTFHFETILSVLVGGVSLVLFGSALFRTANETALQLRIPEDFYQWQPARRQVLFLLIALAFSRVLVYGAGLVMTRESGFSLSPWIAGDAPHYLGLAQNGYVAEGDARFHLVFFPLFPYALRALDLLVGNTFVSALLFNNACAIAAGYVLFLLGCMDMRPHDSLRAVKYQFLLPAAFFFSAPMSDALFFLLLILSIYCARKERWVPAGLCGFCAALARMPGVLLAAPLLIEAAVQLRQHKQQGERILFGALKRGAMLLWTLAGLGLYLLLNLRVSGNALQFMTYQREHWGQEFGLPFTTAANFIHTAFWWAEQDFPLVLDIVIPNLLCIFLALVLILYGARRLRASYSVFSLLYFFFAIGPTWLLSGPRYLTCLFPLGFALAKATRRKSADIVLTVLFAAGFIVYMWMFLQGRFVY